MLSKIQADKVKEALELNFLINSPNTQETAERILSIINSYQPFVNSPLQNVPPIQLFACEDSKLLEESLDLQLPSYIYILLAGQARVISKLTEAQYKIRDYVCEENFGRLSIDFNECSLFVSNNTFIAKIHKMWLQESRKKIRLDKVNYCRRKLLKNDFFLGLSYNQIQRICENSNLVQVGVGGIIVQQGKKPQAMFCLVQGTLNLQKTVVFRNDRYLFQQFYEEAAKNKPHLSQFLEEILQDPTQEELKNGQFFTRLFILKQLHPVEIFAGKELLQESKMSFTVRAPIRSKVLAINYNDLYSLDKQQIAKLRNNKESFYVQNEQVRRQYYEQLPWERYKQFLNQEVKFTKKTREFNYDHTLRKDLDFNTKKYKYIWDEQLFKSQQTINKDQLTKNPVSKMIQIRQAFKSKQQQND